MSAEAKASLKAFWAGGRLQLLCIAIVEKFLPLNVRPSNRHSRLPRMICVVLECAGHSRLTILNADHLKIEKRYLLVCRQRSCRNGQKAQQLSITRRTWDLGRITCEAVPKFFWQACWRCPSTQLLEPYGIHVPQCLSTASLLLCRPLCITLRRLLLCSGG